MAGRMAWFQGAVVTAGRRGPDGGDSRADGAVPERGSDGDGGGGGRGGGGVVSGATVKVEEERDGDGGEGGGGAGWLKSRKQW
jgi:hypothetical protein